MTNEELILQKLENLENQLEPMLKFGNNMRELKEDLVPLQNHAFQLMLNELQEVEAGFQLEDLFQLIKQVMRGTKNFIFLLRQMESMIEFVKDRPGHDRRYAMDSSKIRAELGWAPSLSFEDGLKATVQWYLDSKVWLEHVRSGAYQGYYEMLYGERGPAA